MGLDLFRKIYRYNHFEVLNALKNDHPELPRWILRDVYGKVLTRPALDPKTRELAAAAALTVLQVYPQLLSHIKGGLNLGADNDEVREVILQMEAFAPKGTVRKALRILRLGTRTMKEPPVERAQ
jgi:4-carboxymuconolactone decarboxylase